jgi:hypothetical protein
LFVSAYFSWTFVAFPFWILLISICVLVDEFRRNPALLTRQMEVSLAGLPPEIVGAVLGQLVAKFIAGHAPLLRRWASKMVTDLAEELVPLIVEEMIAEGLAPEQWRSADPS